VLLVEDEAALRAALVRQLEARDYRVIPAASAHEALAILRKEGETIDLLLTDVMMPGLLGPELVAVTRNRWPGVGCLYMTGGADDGAVKMIRDSRIPWLKKPFTDAELREALEAVLRDANLQAAL
jgi:two-component system cell cycle sensor histidine kinase/response regulator CckA